MSRAKRNIRILYVEDDETIAFLTKDNLELRGYNVDHVLDGLEALSQFKLANYDVCLIDIMLPRLDGYALATQIRQHNANIPILFLTAKSMTDDKIRGFSLGADDYITKPFSIDELVLRIEVFLRRSSVNYHDDREIIRIGRSEYDHHNQLVECKGKRVKLTQRENELLKYFLQHSNRLVKREDILKSLWGDDDYFLGRSLDVFISRLRKIFAGESSILIENIHGVGFRFNTDR